MRPNTRADEALAGCGRGGGRGMVAATGAFGVLGRRDDHDDRRHGQAGLFRGRRPGDRGAADAPAGVAVDGQGNVYIADFENHRVRKVSPGGTITTFAGTGRQAGFSGDGGPATSARLYGSARGGGGRAGERLHRRLQQPPGAQGEPRRDDHDVRRHGAYRSGFSGDGGPATSARLYAPDGVAVDGQGNVYIADSDNHRVRKVSPGGTITTFAGTGMQGFSGDGGPATSAQLRYPHGVAVDGQGNVYIADCDNGRVRKVSPGGTITTFAGTAAASRGDGGPATSAQLRPPRMAWRWTGRGTSTSPTTATTACAR